MKETARSLQLALRKRHYLCVSFATYPFTRRQRGGGDRLCRHYTGYWNRLHCALCWGDCAGLFQEVCIFSLGTARQVLWACARVLRFDRRIFSI